jgi:phosphate starvation-inducible PhoH-like protein
MARKKAVDNDKPTKAKIHQRDKLDFKLNIRELDWTPKQQDFIKQSLDKENRIFFIDGPAGTSKSILAVYCALKLLDRKNISDIIYIRSAVESSDSKLGFLPGDATEKLHFYNIPFMEKLDELLPAAEIEKLEKEERISMYPVNYARGMNWNAKCIIFDEAQNSSLKEIITVLTRLGHFSRCFVLADPFQTDLNSNKTGGFKTLKRLFSDEESMAYGMRAFKFNEDDVMRSEMVKFMLKKLRELQD